MLVLNFLEKFLSFSQLLVVLFGERESMEILLLWGPFYGTLTKLVVAKFFSSFSIRIFKGNLDNLLVIEVVRDESKESLMSAHQGWLLIVVDDANIAC